MIKKVLVAAIAAGAFSVPFAGTALASPPTDPGSSDNGVGHGGIPQKLGTFVDTGITPKDPTNPATPPTQNPGGGPTPPGKVFFKSLAGLPGNMPDAVGAFESGLWSGYTLEDGTVVPSNPDDWTNITPGLAIKPLTPGCDKGRSGVPAGTTNCVG